MKTIVDRQASTFTVVMDFTGDAKSVVGATRLEDNAVVTAGRLLLTQGFHLADGDPVITWTDEWMDELGTILEVPDLEATRGTPNASRLSVTVPMTVPEGL